jgi:hypothetical protein
MTGLARTCVCLHSCLGAQKREREKRERERGEEREEREERREESEERRASLLLTERRALVQGSVCRLVLPKNGCVHLACMWSARSSRFSVLSLCLCVCVVLCQSASVPSVVSPSWRPSAFAASSRPSVSQLTVSLSVCCFLLFFFASWLPFKWR